MTDSKAPSKTRIAYLECIGGLSGDMFVGALLDAGWPEGSFRRGVEWLRDELAELRVEDRMRHALAGKGIVVVPRAPDPGGRAAIRHAGPVGARDLRALCSIVREAPLPPPVVDRACEVFTRLAKAEARAHGVDADQVHFHEVGGVDALVDVCSACLGLHELGIARLHVSTIPLGAGVLEGSHGRLPLPAPAAAYLLESAPVRWVQSLGERCTPTGAALAATLGTWDAPPAMRIERIGCGAGTHDFADIPNIARLFVGEPLAGTASSVQAFSVPDWGWTGMDACPGVWREIVVLETQIDDATPEDLADLAARLQGGGALEVLSEPIVMKKGRLGARMTVIARPGREEPLAEAILRDSTTLGLRWQRQWRRELIRSDILIPTPYGEIRTKLAWRGGRWTGKPEYESCRAAADAARVSVSDVRRAAIVGLARLTPSLPAPGNAEDSETS